MNLDNRTDTHTDAHHLSTGAGIAIAGIWLAAASLTAVLVLVTFVWAPEQVLGTPAEQAKDDGGGALFLLILLALPMLAASWATKWILGRD